MSEHLGFTQIDRNLLTDSSTNTTVIYNFTILIIKKFLDFLDLISLWIFFFTIFFINNDER